jgi:hypothetical protein
VKNLSKERILLAVFVVLGTTLGGCATRPAPDIKGRWKAVNHYAETTQAIPLCQSYVFYPYPMDGTLKTMLTRWARDSRMALSYLHPSDFTLHAPVAQIRTSSLEEAVSLLSTIYAEQRVSITTTDNQIIVRAAESTRVATTTSDNQAGAAN